MSAWPRHWRPGVVVALAGLLGAGCSSLNPLNWWGGETGPKLAELPEIRATVTLRSNWQLNVGNARSAVLSPAVTSDSIYAAAYDGSIVKVNAKSGTPVWRVNVGSALSAGVGSGAELAVVGTPEGEVIAVGTASGETRWRARVSSEVLAPPVVAGDLVLVRSADSRVFALDAKDGRRRWVYQRSASSLTVRSPAGLVVAHGNAYGGFSGGKLVAIALSNGGMRWEATVALPRGSNELDRITDVVGLPWVSEREICAVAYQGRIACFDATNGNALWGRAMSSVSGLAADSGYVIVSDDKGAIHALDRSNGTSVWRQDKLARRGLTAPVTLGNYIAVADSQGYVHLLARDSGGFAGRIATDGSTIEATPVAFEAGLLVQTRNGNLIAFNLQ